MSAMRAGSAPAGVSAQALTAAADALRSAIEAGGDQLPQVGRERAENVLAKTSERIGIAGDHTVAA